MNSPQWSQLRYGKPKEEWFLAVCFSAEGRWIATGNADGIVKVLDIQNQQCVLEVGQRALNHGIKQLAFSPDGHYLAASRYHFGPVSIWSMETGASVANFVIEKPKRYGSRRFPICFSCDGTRLAHLSRDNEIAVSHIATGEQITRFTVHSSRVDKLVFSLCGQFLAAGIQRRDTEPRSAVIYV